MSHTFIQKLFPPNIVYRNFIFIPLFFTFYIVLTVFDSSAFLLQHFNDRPVSIASYEGLDIENRVTVFYRAIAFGVILLILFTRLMVVIREYFTNEELLIANGISLAGFCLLFFKLLGADMSSTIHVIFAMLLICAAGFVSHQVKKRFDKDFTTVFVWTVVTTVSIFFLQWHLFNFLFGKILFSLPVVIVFTGIPIYILFTDRYNLTFRLLKASQPLIFLPLLSIAATELFMILNQREIFVSPKTIYLAGILLIFLTGYFLYRKYNHIHPHQPFLKIIFRYHIPVLLAGIACIALYQPVVQPEIDWFEDANHVLPLHQWFNFGKIPFLDSFNSHAVSDFGFGWLYSLFNGNDPMGVFVYGFLLGVIYLLVIYFFVYKITGDGFLAIWFTLAYPYTGLLIPSYFNIVPLTTIAFILLYEKQSVRNYVLYFGSLLFMLFWRIDLGSSTLFAGVFGLAMLIFFVPSFKTNKNNLFKALGITLSFLFVLFVIAFIHSGSHLMIALKDALNYMSSFQSYGITGLSSTHDINYFSLYFLFPVVILLTLVYFIYNLISRQSKDSNYNTFSLAIIFLGLFYFSNLQRGLVRHTMAEQWDTALTSYAFFIITAVVFIRYLNKNIFTRFFVLFIVSTVLISNYVFTTPDLKTNNFYSHANKGLEKPLPLYKSAEKITRIKEDPSLINQYGELTGWLNNTISKKSTFLDFSNSPMLYYYTNRIVPNYFDQIPHTAHNEYLQKRFIEDLKNFDIPVTVFSNVPMGFWDNLDGIPNCIRHYRIAEYIYRNYKPAYIINQHSIWIKKDQEINENGNETISLPIGEAKMKGITASEDSLFFHVDSENGSINFRLKTPVMLHKYNVYIKMNFTSDRDAQIIVHYKSSEGNFNDRQKEIININKGLNEIFIMIKPFEEARDFSALSIDLPGQTLFTVSSLTVFSAKYYKDLFSNQPSNYSIKWIPFLWGAYDKNYVSGKIPVEKNILKESKTINANSNIELEFDPVKNKENGNYINIKARVPSGKQTDISLSYGQKDEKNGSFLFSLKNDTLFHDYLVRVSSQYNWYSRDNSWLRISPAGNDIEVKKIELLKGD